MYMISSCEVSLFFIYNSLLQILTKSSIDPTRRGSAVQLGNTHQIQYRAYQKGISCVDREYLPGLVQSLLEEDLLCSQRIITRSSIEPTRRGSAVQIGNTHQIQYRAYQKRISCVAREYLPGLVQSLLEGDQLCSQGILTRSSIEPTRRGSAVQLGNTHQVQYRAYQKGISCVAREYSPGLVQSLLERDQLCSQRILTRSSIEPTRRGSAVQLGNTHQVQYRAYQKGISC